MKKHFSLRSLSPAKLAAAIAAGSVVASQTAAARVTVGVASNIADGLDTSALVTAIGTYGAGIVAALAAVKAIKYILAVIV